MQADQLPGCISPVVTNNRDDGSSGSLRFIIANACAGSKIIFAPSVVSPITLTRGELVINKNLTISGPGADKLTVQRSITSGANFGIFIVTFGNFNAAISGLTIFNGNAPGNEGGGGILNQTTGILTVTGCAINRNRASAGGGISNFGPSFVIPPNTGPVNNTGTVNVINSTISNNISNGGGGIYNWGTVNVTNSTISGNETFSPVNNGGSSGGGIYNISLFNSIGAVTLTNSTISNNTTGIGTGSGGGIFNNGSSLKAKNTIIALNTSTNG